MLWTLNPPCRPGHRCAPGWRRAWPAKRRRGQRRRRQWQFVRWKSRSLPGPRTLTLLGKMVGEMVGETIFVDYKGYKIYKVIRWIYYKVKQNRKHSRFRRTEEKWSFAELNPTASVLKDGCALGSMTAAMPTDAMTRDKDIKDSLADIDMLLKPFNLASDSTAA